VRAQAAWALGRVGATEAIAPLVAALPDRAWWVRHHAAYALAALGAEGRAALLGVTRQSSDPYARDIAEEALGGGFPNPASRA
jgi:HEAT repeat protein